MKPISAAEALHLLQSTGALQDLQVTERLDILAIAETRWSEVDFPMRFSNCVFEELNSSVVYYKAPVEWDRCVFRRIWLTSGVYFTKGLHCHDCEFQSRILFDSGGHNGRNTPILFERVKFHSFVDFFDCWFTGPVILKDVEFLEGTNLLSEEKGWVRFDVPPVFENVAGPLDLSLNLEFKDGELVVDELGPRARGRIEAEKIKSQKKKGFFQRYRRMT